MKRQAAVGTRLLRLWLGQKSESRGMKLWARVMLVTTLTLFVSIFMNQGWYGPGLAQADVTPVTSPTSASGWTTSTNVYTLNTQYATFTGTAGTYLVTGGYGFAIPAGSTINGVQATVVGRSSGTNATNRTIRINLTTNGTAAVGTNKTQALNTTDASFNLGTTSDLWGASLTTANVNTATFGVLIRDNDGTSSGTFSIDHVTLAITYTLPVDITAPAITTFTAPTASSSLTISGIALAATDAVGVTGYLINENSAPPAAAAVNLASAPTSYAAASSGVKTLYAWARDAAGNVSNSASQTCVITLAGEGNPLIHNSASLGNKYGIWGVAGGKYGEFVCTTCHNKSTNNVKRVADTITAPLGSWSSSKTAGVAVIFNNMTAFGNDAGARTTSTQVCQVCHSQTAVHRYNKPVAQADSNHKGANQTNCTDCHSHADAFKGKGCTACHGSTAASANPITTGKHTVHIANAVYGCADCHAKSVTDDETIKGDPTAHQNTVYGDFSGARAGGSYAAGNCSNVYCHTDGKGGAPAVAVNWATGPAITDCKGCHGAGSSFGEPAYVGGNSHGTHVSAAADCVTCHYATTANGTSIKPGGSHTNKFIEVDGSSSIGFAGGAKTCSNASCHADPYSAGITTTPAWGTSAGCSACHSAFPIGASGPATGSHALTGHAAACTACHAAGTSATTVPSAGHTDGNIDVANVGYQADVTKHAAGSGYATCSAASCHGNVYGAGSATTPAWGSTGNGCSSCHSVAIGANGPATGSHAAHTGSLCTDCHAAGTSETTKPATGHADGDIDVTNGYPATARHAAGTYSGTCSTASCHINVYGAGLVVTPVWGVNANCSACHSIAIGANGPATGSHAAHAGSLCTDCHAAGTSETTKPATGHVDGNIDVTNGYPATAKHAAGTYTGTCSTASCHVNVYGSGNITSPVWGVNANCSACHSIAIGANGPATGGHAAHAGSLCTECHAAGTSETTKPATGHADGNIDVTNVGYQSDVTKHAAGSGYTTCSAASCHPNVYGSGSATTPEWGSTGNGCSACHSVAMIGVNGPVTGSHTNHTGVACTACHAAGTSPTTVPSTGHADGNIDVANVGYPADVTKHAAGSGYSSCSNLYCHSDGTKNSGYTSKSGAPTWGGSAASCVTCHGGHYNTGNPAFSSLSTGRHRKHLRQYAALTCNICHAATVSNNTTISDPTKHVNSQINVSFTGVPATGGIPAFSDNNHAPGVQTGTCSTVYCHSNAQLQQGGANLVFRNLTGGKMWFAAGTLNCSGCHGSTSSPNINPVTSLSGKHGSHLDLAVNPNMGKVRACGDCHINGGTTVRLNHVNGMANYSGTMAGGQKNLKLSTGRCSTVYCHSDGKGTFKTMSTTNWFSASTLSCNGCHGDAGSAATLSGKHNEHINFAAAGGNFGCIECHASTAVSSTTINTLGNHVNALKNFSGAKAYKTGFVAGTGTCSTYCHTDGKGNAVAPPLWTSALTLDCAGCHATSGLTTVGHPVHLGANATCANCHNSTTTNNTTITGAAHIDGTASLDDGGSFGVKPVEFSYAGGGTCNNISCHSPAATGPYNNTATWGPAGSASCETCHPKANLSGHHSIHMGALDLTNSGIFYNMTANRTPVQTDAVLTHGFGCANCHPLNSANHLNGSIDVDMSSKGVAGTSSIRFLNSTTVGSLPQYTGGACSNIYCHSNASRVANELVYKPTPSWVGGSFSGDRCAACHDNQPATGAHAAHAVGNHTNNDVPHSVMIAGNVYNGKSGKVGISNRANTAHGNPNNSTTIGCYICHQATVTSKANDKNTKCAVCHYNGNPFGAALKGNAAINNIKNHVNGSREIQFPAIKVISKAQIRPESFKFYSGVWKRTTYKNMSTLSFDTAKTALDTATMWHPSTPMESNCTNIACHNGKTVAWNMANWNDPNKCMDCHNQL